MIGGIEGLSFERRARLANGASSYVVPFATCRPFNIVFHGTSRFDYGHFGIHLGQQDELTFLGPSNQQILARFIDCRKGSKTFGLRHTMNIFPSSSTTLVIAPGIAHAFDGLENVTTLNTYQTLLPDPRSWAEGVSRWNINADVLNIPMDVADGDIPIVVANSYEASDVYYGWVAEQQRSAFSQAASHDYPFTEDIKMLDGSSHRIEFTRRRLDSAVASASEPNIGGIPGLDWRPRWFLPSGPASGFVPIPDERPFYVVDHGADEYSHDAFGIHSGQEDNLMFSGDPAHVTTGEFVDCRELSSAYGRRVTIAFNPSPTRMLIIPPGVAHRFERLERIFTINVPRVFLAANSEYDSANDVIDWPLEQPKTPSIHPNLLEADRTYYQNKAREQQSAIESGAGLSATPVVLAVDSPRGPMRVALRRRLEDAGVT
jgi:dTDP-4-dehydrorhamnose 3,5-epimerase-like enzyme